MPRNRQKQRALCEESEGALKSKRDKDRERQRRRRQRLAAAAAATAEQATAAKVTAQSTPPQVQDSPVYSSSCQLNRATNRVKTLLPKSPRKKKAVIRKLADDFKVSMKWPNKKSRMSRIPNATVTKVEAFYIRGDVSRMCPGKRDVVTVRKNGKKEKRQKQHTSTSIKEAFVCFKDENPDIKLGLSKFAELRPEHVLLSSQMPKNVCVCMYHENFILAVETLHSYCPSIPLYKTEFPASCLVDPVDEKCWFSECRHESCGFQGTYTLPEDDEFRQTSVKWKKWTETDGRLTKNEITGTLLDL